MFWFNKGQRKNERRGRKFNSVPSPTRNPKGAYHPPSKKKRRQLISEEEEDALCGITLQLDALTFHMNEEGEWKVPHYTGDKNKVEKKLKNLEIENKVLDAKNNMIRLKNEVLLHNIVQTRHEMSEIRAEIEKLKKNLHPHIHLHERVKR